jgi:hypothetical protein
VEMPAPLASIDISEDTLPSIVGLSGGLPPRATCHIVQSTRELPSSLSFLKKSMNFLAEA